MYYKHLYLILLHKIKLMIKKFSFFLFLILVCSISKKSYSQSSVLMKIAINSSNIVKGESRQAGYTDYNELSAFGQGDSSCMTCRPIIGDFTVNMLINAASIFLKSSVLKGNHLLSVDLVFLKATNSVSAPYYKIHMEDVRVTKSSETSGFDGVMGQQISFVPLKFAWAYYIQDQAGTLTFSSSFGWDTSSNTQYNYTF